MRSLIHVLSLASVALTPAFARAADPSSPSGGPASTPPSPAIGRGQDDVLLKNGGMVRGTITEIDPNKSVTVVVEGSGAVRTFAFAEVDRVARGAHSVADGPTSSAPPPSAPSELRADLPGLARIHIVSPDPRVQLWRRLDRDADFVCRAPCDIVADGRDGAEFYFRGSGVTKSAPFLLFDKQGDLAADVRPGSSGRALGGIITLAAGAASMIVGGIAVGEGVQASSQLGGSGDGATTAGAMALGTGAIAAIAGVLLLVANRTTFDLHPPRSAPPAPARPTATAEESSLPGSGAVHPGPSDTTRQAAPIPHPAPVEDALPADEDPCQLAADYDRRAAAASEPVKSQLLRIAAHKHRDCDLLRPRTP